MTDFRIAIPTLQSSSMRELDWESDKKRWALSEKEYMEIAWIQNLEPTDDDIRYLYEFFRIPDDALPLNAIVHMNPNEIIALHHKYNNKKTIYSVTCETCGKHWYVFRWDFDVREWRVFGRSCDFEWKRGDGLGPEDVYRFSKLIGDISEP